MTNQKSKILLRHGSGGKLMHNLIHAGIRAILNFVPVRLNVPKHGKLRNVDLSTQLINLTYFLSASK